jgi:hypothetical protein
MIVAIMTVEAISLSHQDHFSQFTGMGSLGAYSGSPHFACWY